MNSIHDSTTSDAVTSMTAQACELFEKALDSLARRHNELVQTDNPRLLFPSGIELITLRIQLTSAASLTFTIAGKEAKYGSGGSLDVSFDTVDQSGNE